MRIYKKISYIKNYVYFEETFLIVLKINFKLMLIRLPIDR